MIYISLDNETTLISEAEPIPELICVGMSILDLDTGKIQRVGGGTRVEGTARKMWEEVLDTVIAGEATLVNQRVGFDLMTARHAWPDLTTKIFDAVYSGRVLCIRIREILLNISDFGRVEFKPHPTDPEAKGSALKYDLASLVLKYTGRDIFENKEASDAWRTNYSMLKGEPFASYPPAAAKYVVDDTADALEVFREQEVRKKEFGLSTTTEEIHTARDFCLMLWTAEGMEVDKEAAGKTLVEIQAVMDTDMNPLLVEAGVLRPAEPPKAKKNGTFTKGAPSSVNMQALRDHIVQVAEAAKVSIQKTEKGAVATASEFLQLLVDETADPTLQTYLDRQDVGKLVSTYLPRIANAESGIVRFPFNGPKETFRTGSAGSDTYPSMNGQNMDPRVRPIFHPREGNTLYSVDYSTLELVTLAQIIKNMFGHSALLDQIRRGIDPHAYLGAQIAFESIPAFQEGCRQAKCETRDDVYRAFRALKESLPEDYKHFRTLAKPVGLGYPGGLGPKTMATLARSTYQVEVTLEQAERFREIWFDTYPEMRAYFASIQNDHIDERNSKPGSQKYRYTTPLGAVRAGCSFCAAANGKALQSPAAEGTALAIIQVTREVYDRSLGSVLFGTKALIFIHDEFVGEAPHVIVNDVVKRIREIGVGCMRQITPDVPVKMEGCLMLKWHKRAEPVYDAEGRLIPWSPPAAA